MKKDLKVLNRLIDALFDFEDIFGSDSNTHEMHEYLEKIWCELVPKSDTE